MHYESFPTEKVRTLLIFFNLLIKDWPLLRFTYIESKDRGTIHEI